MGYGIRAGPEPAAVSAPSPTYVRRGRHVDIIPWLEALLDRTGYIEISGIGSGVGRTKDASRYPIEQLYTKLRSRDAARTRVAPAQSRLPTY